MPIIVGFSYLLMTLSAVSDIDCCIFEHFAEVNTFVISIVSKKIYPNPIKARTNFPEVGI